MRYNIIESGVTKSRSYNYARMQTRKVVDLLLSGGFRIRVGSYIYICEHSHQIIKIIIDSYRIVYLHHPSITHHKIYITGQPGHKHVGYNTGRYSPVYQTDQK